MKKISLKLNGQLIKTIELESGREYFAGRAEDADFQLGDHRGISRQHLKFFEQNGQWCCESLSKFLHPKMGAENFETLEMTEPVSFTLSPYEFEFHIFEERSEAPVSEARPEIRPERALVAPKISEPTPPMESHTRLYNNSEATTVGAIQVTPVLRIMYPDSSENESLKLEGQVWTAGRDGDSEIQLRDPKVSRKHFEINRNPEGYYVTDLGSANGTYLNGQKLAPHEPTRLLSGDVLKALQIEVHFEIKASQLPAVTAQPLSLDQPFTLPPMHWGNKDLAVFQPVYPQQQQNYGYDLPTEEESSAPKKVGFDFKKHKVRIAIGVALALLFFFIFSGPDKKIEDSKSAAPAAGNTTPAFEKLSQEQRTAVKDSLSLARNLYVQGKYSLCLAEIARLHEVVPFYDNSKELESFCIQGHELTQRKIDNDRKEAEKAMVEQKIVDVTSTCKEKYGERGEVGEVRNCLTEAMELNPEHPLVVEQIQRAEERVREKQLMVQQQADDLRRRNSVLSILSNAKKLKSQGRLAKAKEEYQRFISTAHSSLTTQRSEAQRELASVTSALASKVNLLMEKCKAYGGSGKYKDAYKACDGALKEDPNTPSAKGLQEEYLAQLRRQMKVLYEDARLEESLGNVDTAKEKWKKILEEDLEFDDYYKKSSLKLRQYGAL